MHTILVSGIVEAGRNILNTVFEKKHPQPSSFASELSSQTKTLSSDLSLYKTTLAGKIAKQCLGSHPKGQDWDIKTHSSGFFLNSQNGTTLNITPASEHYSIVQSYFQLCKQEGIPPSLRT